MQDKKVFEAESGGGKWRVVAHQDRNSYTPQGIGHSIYYVKTYKDGQQVASSTGIRSPLDVIGVIERHMEGWWGPRARITFASPEIAKFIAPDLLP